MKKEKAPVRGLNDKILKIAIIDNDNDSISLSYSEFKKLFNQYTFIEAIFVQNMCLKFSIEYIDIILQNKTCTDIVDFYYDNIEEHKNEPVNFKIII